MTDNGFGVVNVGGSTFESRGNNVVRGNGTNTSGTITLSSGN